MTSTLFDPLFGAGDVDAAIDDRAWLAALCEVETALARACKEVGLIDLPTALEIGAAAVALAGGDPAELGRRSVTGGNPVIPLVESLRERVRSRAGDTAAEAVHLGATSQDILDSAAMLVTSRALDIVLPSLRNCADHCAAVARAHRDTPMIGRTLMQQAVPTTFGALAAVWGGGLDRAVARLSAVRASLPMQLGGAGGTLAALYPRGTDVRAALAEELDLRDPGAVWHTDRGIVIELAGTLGLAAVAVGKVAGDVVLLSQTEIGELREAAPGGSSSMPHKRNPIAAITARAAAAATPGLVATLLAAGAQELQRGAGPWHAEWPALTALLRSVGGATARLRECLVGLEVDAAAMLANVGDHPLELGHAGDLVDGYLGGTPMTIVPLSWREDGPADGPPLVLLNSVGSTTEMWTPCLAPLAEQFRVIRIDTRGHGDSPPSPPGTTTGIADLAADVLGVLDRLGVQQTALAGLSLGGMVGMWLAIHRPYRISRLALLCTSAHLTPASLWRERAAAVRAGGMGAISDAVVARWLTPALAERDPELRATMQAVVDSVDPESYAQCCEAIETMDQLADLGRIAAPTLVIGGAEDPATPTEHQQAIVDRVADARLEVVPDASHVATYEQPGRIAALLIEHFRGGATLAGGYRTRRAVLGDGYVDAAIANTSDLTRDFQSFLTRYAWGDVWTRTDLTRRERSIATVTALVVLGAEHELRSHVRGALRNGLTPDEIIGLLQHVAVYSGLPRANRAVAIAAEVLHAEAPAHQREDT